MSNRKDRQRRQRRARENQARGRPAEPEPSQAASPPDSPPPEPGPKPNPSHYRPGQSGNVAAQFQPGQSGNPAGSSRRGRLASAVNRLLDKPGLEDDVATTIVAMTLGTAIQGRDPKIEWWRELRSLIDGSEPRVMIHRNIESDVIVPSETNGQMDAAMAERLLAAADPATVPLLEDIEEGQ